jgi:phospholipid transport system transporter-binding protein
MFRPTLTLTIDNAKTALQAGLRAIESGQTEIDMAQLTAVDSSAVSILLAWQRAARLQGRTLKFSNLPANLQSLAQLYGVADLIMPALPEGQSGRPTVDLPHH